MAFKVIVLDEPTRKFLDSLKSLRESSGFTLSEAAEKLSTTWASVYDWEAGRCYPTLEALMNLANLFNYDLSESLNHKYFYKTLNFASIRRLLKHYGFSYKELGELTGYKRGSISATLSMHERGTLTCLAAILKVLEQEKNLAEFRRRQL